MKPYQRILHPVDLNEISRPAFCHALKVGLCATGFPVREPEHRRPAMLEMLHCHDDGNGPAFARFPQVRKSLVKWGVLEDGAEPLAVRELGLSVRKQWVHGQPRQAIVRETEGRHCDLLVMASHARAGWSHFLNHSVSAPALQACRVPGLLIPHDCQGFVHAESGHLRLQRILLPVAPEPQAGPALSAAVRLLFTLQPSLGDLGGQLMQAFVGPESAFPETQRPVPPVGWSWERQVLEGRPVEALQRFARQWQPQLVVMTSRGQRSWRDRCFGSTAEKLLHDLGCPVLVVPSPEAN